MIFLKQLPAKEKVSWPTTSHFVKKTSRYDIQETHCVQNNAASIVWLIQLSNTVTSSPRAACTAGAAKR
ncbi:hypothetical protein T10_9619 [Trichinella papuae]|uniref:Uncharacterized protein n=1 Tax=Trichinella papuae TaxID=268474 RepID=A0A0V1MR58_9BILA|nr:hypothetical protein T10_9619 [Trichinella papuae]